MNVENPKPDFSNLTATLLNRPAKYIPLIELGIHPSIKAKIMGRPLTGLADDIEFMRNMGYDFVKLQPKIQLDPKRSKAGSEDNSDRAWSPEGTGIITNWEEFEKFPWPDPGDIDYSAFEQIRSIIPDDMGVIGQYGDIFTNVWELMGFETFAIGIYEQPDLITALFEKLSTLILSMFDTMADMDWVGALWYSDDIAYSSNLMVSPDFLRKNFFPLLGHIGKLTDGRGIPFIYHTDGVLWEVMDDIISSGVTALHPIEPKSMDIREVKLRVGDKLCLCGGIEVDLLARGKVAEIEELTTVFLNDIGSQGGYCLGSSNSIPDYVRSDNYLAMIQTALKHRQK